MPAFTHLCKNLNISLAHNILTLYQNGEKQLDDLDRDCFDSVESKLTPVGFRYQHHKYLHDDDFDNDIPHIHIRFPEPIDEVILEKILNILKNEGYLDQEEKTGFIEAYHVAKDSSAQQFNEALLVIKMMSVDLTYKASTNPKSYGKVAKVASALSESLEKQSKVYFNTCKTPESYKVFMEQSTNAVNTAREEYEKLMESSTLLDRVIIGISRLGDCWSPLALAINEYRSNSNFFFTPLDEEDAVVKLDNFEVAQQQLVPI